MPEIQNQIYQWINAIDALVIEKIIISMLLFLVLWFLLKVTQKLVDRSKLEYAIQFRIKKTASRIHKVLLVIVLFQIWFVAIESYLTYLGLLSAGIAVALKDPIANFFAWIIILWRRPFEVGDRIEVSGVIGDVVDLRLFTFALMEVGNWVHADQSTGRVVHLPNSKVFTESIANYSKGIGCIWNEIPVTITFGSNWKKAKGILGEIVNQYAQENPCKPVEEKDRKHLVFTPTTTPIVYTSAREYGILLTMRYMCVPQERRGSNQVIWEAVLTQFAEHADIQLAYPTQSILVSHD